MDREVPDCSLADHDDQTDRQSDSSVDPADSDDEIVPPSGICLRALILEFFCAEARDDSPLKESHPGQYALVLSKLNAESVGFVTFRDSLLDHR